MENMLGVMVDCSRNAVMNVASVKKFAKLIRSMGYNTLMLYTEDTYEVDNQPAFGYHRGRYSQAELRELDQYCLSIGMEMIPCIQTLAHLPCIFKWNDVYDDIRDIDDVLLAGDEKTYALIEDMIASLAKCFTTRRIHIGMDEAYSVGLGKYLMQHGPEDRFQIINRHLQRVCEIVEKYGFKPMIWSDMFCKLALNTTNYYEVDGQGISEEKFSIPKDVSLVYWDYYSTDYNRYQKMIRLNQSFGREVIFAGGIWTWPTFIPNNGWSIDIASPALQACRDCGVDHVIFTMWGDDGGECSRFSVLPSLFFAAETARGNQDLENIKAKFRQLFGCDFDAFLLLDEVDNVENTRNSCISKKLMYDDPFMGINGDLSNTWNNAYFASLAKQIHEADFGSYRFVADYCEALCDLLSVKSQLTQKTQETYKKADKEALLRLTQEDYPLAVEKVHAFHRIYRDFWMQENKPQGFEIQDIRLGGMLQRLTTCRERLMDYCNGKFDRIEELEEPRQELQRGISWGRIVSAGVITHS